MTRAGIGVDAVSRWWAWFLPPPASRLRPLESRDLWLAIAIAGIGAGIKASGAWLFLTPFDLNTSPWRFGFEVGHIAAHLEAGHGFAIGTTDGGAIPSAWASPAYPLLLAAVFRVWGTFTAGAADAVVALNCLLQGATAGLLYVFGLRLAGRRAGGMAAVLFLAQPGGWQFLAWAWPSHLFALALSLHGLALFSRGPRRVRWGVGLGATFGFALWVDGAAIALLPVTLLVAARGGGARAAPWTVLAAVVSLVVVLSPWALRNQRELGVLNPLRGNVGVNLWVGNHPDNRAESYHGMRRSPWHDRSEERRLFERGEAAYDRDCRDRAIDWIAGHPSRFAADTALRFSGFWLGEWWVRYGHIAWIYSLGHVALFALATGGAIRRRDLGGGCLVLAVLLFSLSYSVTVHGHGRYRVPVDPVLCLFGALALAGRRAPESAPATPGEGERPAVESRS
jgi:hypothetical protein